jgi:hypothetical protein
MEILRLSLLTGNVHAPLRMGRLFLSLWIRSVKVMKKISEIDFEEKTKKAGIDLPLTIEPALLEKLIPSPFLASLGVSVEQRIENLLSLVKANLAAKTTDGYYIPFIVVKGPFIKEDLLPIIVRISQAEGGTQAITLAQAIDDENEIG